MNPAAPLIVALALVSAGAPAGGLPELPVAVSNNAVAAVRLADGVHLVSAMGLLAGKTWRDTTAAVWHLPPGAADWRALPDVPGGAGRLAGVAVGLGERVYLFGGYTVAADHSEVSVPFVHALDPLTGDYTELAPMPVPVDDTVALPYADRYIYLVSGWHDSGNVNLTQRYDTLTDRWDQATPWPAEPVFGHAGGIVANRIVICDGVRVHTTRAQRRFRIARRCLGGTIRAADGRRIDWTTLAHHPGPARYRMAAAGTDFAGRPVVIFAGGSANAYNYDGIGYDGRPSAGSDATFAWDFDAQRWERLTPLPVATMDHRGLLEIAGRFAIVGGMRDPQRVSPGVVTFSADGHRTRNDIVTGSDR